MIASGVAKLRFPAVLGLVSRSPGGRALLVALLLGAGAAAFVPLADHLGYELAELLALLCGAFGLWVGVSAARLTSAAEAPERPAPGAALLAALAFSTLALLLPVGLILLNGVRRPVCDPLAGLVMVLLLAAPSALLAAATGFCAEALVPRRGGRVAAAVFLCTLLASLVPVAFGPQVFAFHHLGGMFPGPIYDEAIRPTASLLAFRACSLLWAGGAGCLGVIALRWRAGEAVPRSLLVLAGLCGAFALAGSLDAEQLHWQASVRLLDETLGARLEGERVVLHFPREKPEADRKLLLRDAEESAAEVLDFLGVKDSKPARVDVFLFRSAEEKRRLIGAAETSFTKPWLRQIHTNDAPAPHPILRHELAHALAADYARGPFGVPGRLWGAIPEMAFIEGLAVAADWPAGESTVDQDTAALLEARKLTDLAKLFAPGRFYGEAGPSAYATAGSFIRFLWRTRGAEAVRAAYGAPDGLASLGPLDGLVRAHAASLRTLPVPENVRALAALRFQQPSILRRPCPHEVAELQRLAGEAAQRGDAAGAAQLFAKCLALEGDDPNLLIAESRALHRAGDEPGAARAAQAALAHPKLAQAQRAQLLTEAGDLAFRQGDLAGAAARWGEAGALPQPEAQGRALAVRRWMLADPVRFPAIRKLVLDGDTGPEAWLLLRDLDLAQPGEGLPAYLLGRQAQGRGAWETCRRFTNESLTRPLPGAPFEEEAKRIRALCAARAGDVAAARAGYEEILKSQSEARRLEAERALRRL